MSDQALFCPESVAVIGSASEGKLANILIHRLLEGGMPRIYAVNPKAMGVEQVRGYASVLEIEEPVDLAVIASPAFTVKSNLEQCGQKGIRAAVIITSGFSEAGNTEGEQELIAVAKKYGIRFVGPNCAGIVNPHANLLATLETRPEKGNIAVISQSGAVGGMLMSMAKEEGLGISKFVSYGNALDVSVIDFLQWLKDDTQTAVVALYLESVHNGRAFMQALSELTKIKPVIVVKSGKTATGQRAALSHTGAMSGSEKVFDAAIKQCGAIRVENLEEMLDLCKGFSMLHAVAGERLLIVTNSGGPGVMATDCCEQGDIRLPMPEEDLQQTLGKFLPSYAGLKNPIDLTVEGTGEDYYRSLAEGLKHSYDHALVLYIGTPYLKSMPVAQAIGKAAEETGKPVLAVLSVGADIEESRQYLKAHGIPEYPIGERAVQTLSAMMQYERRKSRNTPVPIPQAAQQPLQMENGMLLEHQAKELMEKQGIPVGTNLFVQNAEQACRACEQIGYPVVMKVVSPDIIHKSDVGGVILNIQNQTAAEKAFADLKKIAEGKDFRGVLVCPAYPKGREVILGITTDPQFGAVVAFGLGGIYTEVLGDLALRVAPVSKETAMEMIESIQTYQILKGVRGEKPVDFDALAEAIVRFSELPFRYPEITEADLNPVFAYESGIVAVDARILGAQRGSIS